MITLISAVISEERPGKPSGDRQNFLAVPSSLWFEFSLHRQGIYSSEELVEHARADRFGKAILDLTWSSIGPRRVVEGDGEVGVGVAALGRSMMPPFRYRYAH